MRCNEANKLHSGQAHLRITCLPGSHQRPGDLGNALGLWGSITILRVWVEASYTSLLHAHACACACACALDGLLVDYLCC